MWTVHIKGAQHSELCTRNTGERSNIANTSPCISIHPTFFVNTDCSQMRLHDLLGFTCKSVDLDKQNTTTFGCMHMKSRLDNFSCKSFNSQSIGAWPLDQVWVSVIHEPRPQKGNTLNIYKWKITLVLECMIRAFIISVTSFFICWNLSAFICFADSPNSTISFKFLWKK